MEIPSSIASSGAEKAALHGLQTPGQAYTWAQEFWTESEHPGPQWIWLEPQGTFASSPEPQTGVALDGGSAWFLTPPSALVVTYRLELALPRGNGELSARHGKVDAGGGDYDPEKGLPITIYDQQGRPRI